MQVRKNDGSFFSSPITVQTGKITVEIDINDKGNFIGSRLSADPRSTQPDLSHDADSYSPVSVAHVEQLLKYLEFGIKDKLTRSKDPGYFISIEVKFRHDPTCNLFTKLTADNAIDNIMQLTRERTLEAANQVILRHSWMSCLLM